MGVSKGKTSMVDLKSKFAGVVKEVGVPVQVSCSSDFLVCWSVHVFLTLIIWHHIYVYKESGFVWGYFIWKSIIRGQKEQIIFQKVL